MGPPDPSFHGEIAIRKKCRRNHSLVLEILTFPVLCTVLLFPPPLGLKNAEDGLFNCQSNEKRQVFLSLMREHV